MTYEDHLLTPEEVLVHYGILGMHWGIRKELVTTGLKPKTDGIFFNKDGSIYIKAGSNLQRLTRSNDKSMPLKDITYASINEYDNARYIKIIGGKGFFGGGRNQIMTIQAIKDIKAPSRDEAIRLVSDLMLNDSVFRNKNTNILGASINSRELSSIRKDPIGKTANAWYDQTNIKLTFDKKFDPNAPYIQKVVRDTMKSKGYNALRDENDVMSKIAKAPIIIFNPEESLKVVRVTNITDQIRSANKEKLKEYKRQGKTWLDVELYNQQVMHFDTQGP